MVPVLLIILAHFANADYEIIPVTITTRAGNSVSGIGGISKVSCQTGETLLSCGIKGHTSIGGTWIDPSSNNNECQAISNYASYTVTAQAVCGTFPDGSIASITTQTSQPHIKSIAICPTDAILTGCNVKYVSGDYNKIKGSFSGKNEVGPPQTAAWIDTNNKCIAESKQGATVEGGARCLQLTSDYTLKCETKALYTNKANFGTCQSGFGMFGCNTYTTTLSLDGYYRNSNGQCYVQQDNHANQYANAICCQLRKEIKGCQNGGEQVLILRLKDVTTGVCSSAITSTGLENPDNPEANCYSIVGKLNKDEFKNPDGTYELYLTYGGTQGGHNPQDPIQLRWKQSTWITEKFNSGGQLQNAPGFEVINFNPPDVSSGDDKFYGLGRSNTNHCYLDGTSGGGDWFNCVGVVTKWSYPGIGSYNRGSSKSEALYACRAVSTASVSTLPMVDESKLSSVSKDEICRPAYGRGIGTIPPYCPIGYPDLDLALCYPACKSGYDGVGPVCWEQCNSNQVDDGAFCRVPLITVAKKSYGRGVGIIPTSCGTKQYNAGLCYNYCSSGYYGVGPVCWQRCPSGYADHGATCYKHIFSWFFKKTYGRGVGTIPRSCPSHKPDYDVGLCYPNCRSGYYGVGPVCWEHCNGKDIGALCEIQSLQIHAKNSYGRGVGRIRNRCKTGYVNDAGLCYKACKPDDVWDGVGPVCWNKNFGTALGVVFGSLGVVTGNINTCSTLFLPSLIAANAINQAVMKQIDFSAFSDCLWLALKALSGIDPKWDTNTITVAFEISGAIKAVRGLSGFAGLAFNFPTENKLNIYGYTGHCDFFVNDIGFGGEIAIVMYRTVEDIPGKVSYFSVGVSIPGTEIGSSYAYAFSSTCDVVAISSSFSAGFGVSPVDIEGGVCVASEVKLIDTIGRRRIRRLEGGDDNDIAQFKQVSVVADKCFEKISSKYYPQCHSIMSINKLSMNEYQAMCLRIPECIGYVYNGRINRAQILTLLECPINNIEWYDDNDNEEFYINTCIEKQKESVCDNNGFCPLSQQAINIESGKLINQYYAKCPFDVAIKMKLLPPPADHDKYGSKWYNIFTFDANGNIPYPGLFINYRTNQYKLQIGQFECISSPSIKSLISNDSNNNKVDNVLISIKCNGKSSLYVNDKLLCKTEKYNIFDIDSSEGQVVTIFTSDSSYESTNGKILSVVASSSIYPWNGLIDDDISPRDNNIIFETNKGIQYLLSENTLIAPFLKFEGNYLIKTDVYLQFDDNNNNKWTEEKYNIFEIGFDDDLDVTINDIILNYDDDKVYGVMLGISTSDETVRFCYEGNKNFNKNKWNIIAVFVEYTKVTLIVNNVESCFIDLSQTPINTHQQMVPLLFASGRFNAIKGSFRNVVIRNNVKSVSRSLPKNIQNIQNIQNQPIVSNYQWRIIICALFFGNIILVYLTCFYKKTKNKNAAYGVVKYLSETETESV